MNHLSLNGAWTVARAGERERLPARVPGDVYGDLLRAKRIPDPYWRDNENGLQWIGESDWIYERDVRVPARFLRHDRLRLRCDGLDTLAEISVNGRRVGRADNMYRVWEFDVSGLVRPGRNTIRVLFRSVVPCIRRRQSRADRPLSPGARGELDGRGWVRKEPCNFGWDWGVKAIGCGIWRDIGLIAYSGARWADAHIVQDHSRLPAVTLAVALRGEVVRSSKRMARVVVSKDGRTVAETDVVLRRGSATARLTVPCAELWWPNNLGEQPLYDVAMELRDADGTLLDVWRKRIGLRTLRLDRPRDKWGEGFRFVVNGVPFFAKGANWIPADAVLSRLKPTDYRRLIADSAAANMNMLRVWGGGIYEHDVFYDLCDEYGLCVWQDFMFACGTYPTYDRAFMANVEREVKDNIRRLRHHASLALWCGNNELEQLNVGPRWTGRTMTWPEYRKLFDRLLPRLTRSLDPQRDYWPSSPHSPCGDRTDWNNPRCGDAHLWSVWHGGKPFEWYRECEHRFNSEFGFQSFPEPRTVAAFTAPADRNATSPVMEHHQRSGIGNTVIVRTMLEWFRLPERFDMLLWLSQIQQGMAMKYAVEHWRRSMPRGMGTLYWQLNDCWPVASWSSLDYFGRWKALHYMARAFFAPRLLSLVEDAGKGTVEIHATNDLRLDTQANIVWRLFRADGRVLDSGQAERTVPGMSHALVRTLRLRDALRRYGAEDLLLHAEWREGRRTVSDNLALWARPKRIEWRDPLWSVRIVPVRDGFDVILAVRRPALWCWLELAGKDARYADNFFHLLPGRSRRVRVTPARPTTLSDFRRRLRVRSLRDTYASSNVRGVEGTYNQVQTARP